MIRRLLAIILCIGVIGVGVYWLVSRPAPPVFGGIRAAHEFEKDQEFHVQKFHFNWDAAEQQLSITHEDFPNHAVFSTPAHSGFVSAGKGVMTSEESRGYFDIEESRAYVCKMQTIQGMASEAGRFTVSGALNCDNNKTVPYRISFSAASDRQLQYQVTFEDTDINRTYLTWASDKNEHYFGFGEQYTELDMKGKRLPVLVQEQGVGRGRMPLTLLANITNGAGGKWSNSYAPIPQFISSGMQSLYSENKEYQVFHFTNPDKSQLEVFSGEASGRIYAGGSPAELLKEHTSVVGRMKPLPDWTQHGLILGVQGGTDVVSQKLEKLQEQGVPIVGLWIQDWVGQRTTSFGKQLWWNWELDRDHYSGWAELQQKLEQSDIKVLGYVNPFLVEAGEKSNVRNDLYTEAKQKGYFIRDGAGRPLAFQITSFDAGLIDLTNPEARSWLKGIIKKELVGNGFAGWMADFGEALPLDAKLYSGESGESYHNRYPEEWAKLNVEIMEESGLSSEGLFFLRSGFSESPRYASSFWEGDQLVSWDRYDGLKSAVTGLLSSGLSGFSINHSDIGGYTTIKQFPIAYTRSEELLKRWLEVNAFTALFRSHEGNRPDDNAQIYNNPDMISHTKKFAEIYSKLAPYRSALMQEAQTSGAPLVRPLFFEYPQDAHTYSLHNQQFMLGRDLLIAPVLDAGVDELKVYLPEGEWVHAWSGAPYHAGKDGLAIEVKAPIGEPGVFVRAGSLPEQLLLSRK